MIINNKKGNLESRERLSTEKLRQFEGFEHFTDEQAEDRIRGLKTLADIMCKCYFSTE